MKLQHLAVIFVLIIIPISLVMTQYIQTQIETIRLQTAYTQSLITATSDALKAFQINSVHNKYSDIGDSKIRDIKASINTFYNSLVASISNNVFSKDDLSDFVPAILFSLYDGYYIYGLNNNELATLSLDKNNLTTSPFHYEYTLKPYIYYSCQYRLPKNGSNIIVNYTLDNAITVYGDFGKGYETRSGYLIDYRKVSIVPNKRKTLLYDDVEIAPEDLKEHLITIEDEDEGTILERDYPYIVYQNKKVYQDVDDAGNAIMEESRNPIYNSAGQIQYDGNGNIRYQIVRAPKYFWYDNNKKVYLQSEKPGLLKYINDNGVGFKSISAYEYYTQSAEFSKWLVEESGLAQVTQAHIVQNDGTVGAYVSGSATNQLYLSVNTDEMSGNTKFIFDSTKPGNDPLLSTSTFSNHRIAIIRKSIETNLMTAIANYNLQNGNTYEFVMPVIDEINWGKVTSNVSMITFLQGIPISHKYYNNYCVITNTRNEEVINEQSVYVMVRNKDGNYEYHQPGCKELIDKQKNGDIQSMTAYTDLSFMRQSVKVSEIQTRYFYPQTRVKSIRANGTAENYATTGCYNCIVNSSVDYDIDQIISGKIKHYDTGKILYNEADLQVVRKAYLTGLARERQDLYKSNFD